jgi:thiol:disulfide interchange protein DsbC
MKLHTFLAGLVLAFTAGLASANEDAIRKAVAASQPQWPKADEVRKTPMPGIWEVRFGAELFYTDEAGQELIQQGEMIDLRSKRNLTKERIDALLAVKFSELPLADALMIKQGKGTRKLAVFSDPYCGYCRNLERDLAALKDVTIYTFLYPSIAADSMNRSKNVWCSKEPMVAWRDWMIDGKVPGNAPAACAAEKEKALERNLAFGQRYRVRGTPLMLFEDGSRAPGALPGAMVEERLAAAAKPASGAK